MLGAARAAMARCWSVLADPGTWPGPEHTSSTQTTRYGTAQASAWHRCHPRLEHRGPWRDHPGQLPIVEGTLIRLQVEHLPGDRAPKPLWLWTSDPAAAGADVDRAWQAFLRRFDLEHTFLLRGSGPCRMTSHEPGDLAGGAVVLRGCCARRW